MEEILRNLNNLEVFDEESSFLIEDLRDLSLEEDKILTRDFFTGPNADNIYKVYLYELMNDAIAARDRELIDRIREISGIPLKKHTVSLNKEDEGAIWSDVLFDEEYLTVDLIIRSKENGIYIENIIIYAIEEGVDFDELFDEILLLTESRDLNLSLLQYMFDNYGDRIDIIRIYESYYPNISTRLFLDKVIESQV